MYKGILLKKLAVLTTGLGLPFLGYNHLGSQNYVQTSNDTIQEIEIQPIHLSNYHSIFMDSSFHYYQNLPADKSPSDRMYNNEREKILGKLTGSYYQLVPIRISSQRTNLNSSNIEDKIVTKPEYLFARDKRSGDMIELSNTIEIEGHSGEQQPVTRYSFTAPEGYSFLYKQGSNKKNLEHLVTHLPEYSPNNAGLTKEQKKELQLLIK